MDIKVNRDGTVVIPRTRFKPGDNIVVMDDKNTLILKKVMLPKLSEIAERNKEKLLSVREVSDEIHLYRKEKSK